MARLTAKKTQFGFTLIELIAVIVVLSILAVLSTQFVVSSTQSYENVRNSTRLVNTARQALERISRQVRVAHPYSLRIVNSGNCLEFMPIVGSGTYYNLAPDAFNGISPSNTISVSPHTLDGGTAKYFSIGAMAASELYGASAVSRATISTWSSTAIQYTSSIAWQRNSINKRFFVLDDPQAVCVVGTELRFYTGLDANAASVDTSAAFSLLADNISAINPFGLTAASDNRNVNVQFMLNVISSNQSVSFSHSAMVRNVP